MDLPAHDYVKDPDTTEKVQELTQLHYEMRKEPPVNIVKEYDQYVPIQQYEDYEQCLSTKLGEGL